MSSMILSIRWKGKTPIFQNPNFDTGLTGWSESGNVTIASGVVGNGAKLTAGSQAALLRQAAYLPLALGRQPVPGICVYQA